ncbi:hypothetical protein A2707_03705 [Candidatus Saccharibacteria bacterium RIFCSPHIGHO2_01_FULL_45_15]|nr:MAG: hypothetical protein A2707_03705 [Candidatus Saccharibacteria bacterium RIFCSPHIGHO2_01_FULL_45_15]OGL28685.1 MAG: hypothetical protein A3C39_05525 [Candidatus Saccharibacteria bacterium RIFCSPHIGHO2_02_FULL_46_12]OGL31488.1 MAG: hypothetical protein A3E76_03710 [Candidatus Saccharibacteria bacterium RIFCSPHIGHO2_12_FULL_44_22]
MNTSDATIDTQTAEVNRVIDQYFEQSIIDASTISQSYELLWKHLQTLLRSGGKRVRPQMTLLAYDAFGGKNHTTLLPIAAAQELLHFSLLIHDDIIDRDYIRYGVPNIAGQYDTQYHPYVHDKVERIHYANSAAILGGDLMLSGAYQMIAGSHLSSSDKIIAQSLLGQSIFEVAGGELLDTEAAFMPVKPGDAVQIARYKTASYSFVIPLLTGARLAGASESQQQVLRTFAIKLGIAYQLVDDLLGVFGIEEKTGKSTSGDIREGKHTFMVEQCLERLDTEQRMLFDISFGDPDATTATIAKVKELFVTSGAKEVTERTISQYATDARVALQDLTIDPKHLASFEQFITKVTDRTS